MLGNYGDGDRGSGERRVGDEQRVVPVMPWQVLVADDPGFPFLAGDCPNLAGSGLSGKLPGFTGDPRSVSCPARAIDDVVHAVPDKFKVRRINVERRKLDGSAESVRLRDDKVWLNRLPRGNPCRHHREL